MTLLAQHALERSQPDQAGQALDASTFVEPPLEQHGSFQLNRLYQIGLQALSASNYRVAVNAFGNAAQRNHPEALLRLGVLYELGLGVEADAASARDYYTRAALLGSADAAARLAALRW